MVQTLERLERNGLDQLYSRRVPAFYKLAEEWISTVVPQTCKTTHDYRGILANHLLPHFGDMSVNRVTRKVVKQFLLSQSQKGLAKSTVMHHKNCISGVMSLAVEDDLVPSNPALQLQLRIKPAPAGKELFPFEPAELTKLLKAFEKHKPWYHPLVLTLLRTGMMFCEAAGLQRKDVDLENRVVRVRGSFSRGQFTDTTKTGHWRSVDLSRQTAEVLGVWLDTIVKESCARGWKTVPQWVFVNSKGKVIDINVWRRNHWNPIFDHPEMKGIESRPLKQTRHTYITLRLRKGDDIWDIAKQVGHKTTRMIETVYAHWIPGTRKDQVDELDSIS